MEAQFFTAGQLAERGSGDIPRELVSTTHLIYSSPATLAFNSPGAEGYGVKRAGLSVPDSVMLIVSPGCCGRNTSAISRMPGYEDRFFYLTMDETDLITGRHLKKIPKAVAEICRGLELRNKKPRVVMICITCVDALLGTDMERICRRAEEKTEGVRVQPCYMYALTREGRKPPMVHVRQSIYELLAPVKKKSSSVNILGFFAPLEGAVDMDGEEEGSELFPLLRQAGVRRIRQIGSCSDYNDFLAMAEANFNLVLNPEARPAAYDLQERLGIPFIELGRFYQIDRIRAQYAALGQVLQTTFDDSRWETEAMEAVDSFRGEFPDAVFSIGEAMNGNPFELACALVRQGLAVKEIFGTVSRDSYVWINLLAQLSPNTRIYSNLHPSMLHYREVEAENTGSGSDKTDSAEKSADIDFADSKGKVTVSIGRDAGWYHPDVPNVQWNSDVQPFGYRAVTGLFKALRQALKTGSRGAYASAIMLEGNADKTPEISKSLRADVSTAENVPRGFRRVTTPFAPDQSGAVSVLYDMGGICVICDAGGCTGNICGFDEPRWFGAQSAVFSAGLRDMDAILGRDDRLVEKLADAAQQIPASFAAIVGTPVPAVIATDYRALRRMAARRTGLPVISVDSDGMEYYDKGIEKTYLALLEEFCKPSRIKKDACNPSNTKKNTAASCADEMPLRIKKDIAAVSADNTTLFEKSTEETATDPAGNALSEKKIRIAGVWGFTPLDYAGILSGDTLCREIRAKGYDEIICCGYGADIETLRSIGVADINFVLSPAGTAAAKWLQDRYGTPWEYYVPDLNGILSRIVPETMKAEDYFREKKILILHQQTLADKLRRLIAGTAAQVDTAGFFIMNRDRMSTGDVRLREETDLRALVKERKYDIVITDSALEPILSGISAVLIHLPHFAVSGEFTSDY